MTSTPIQFDPFTWVEQLRRAGVPQKQAEAQVKVLLCIVDDRLASKHDVLELSGQVRLQIQEIDGQIRLQLQIFDSRIETKIKELEIKTDYITQELSKVKLEIENVNTRIDEVRGELSEKIERFYITLSDKIEKGDAILSEKIDQVRGELFEKIERGDAALSEKIDRIYKELSEKIERGDAILSEKIDRVYKELSEKIDKISDKFSKWMFGLATLQTAIVLTAFKLMH